MAVPGAILSMPYIGDTDRADIEFGIEMGFEFLAASFARTKEDILDGLPAEEVYKEFVQMLNKYCDKYDRNDKFALGGYNVQFDLGKLNGWFKHFGDNYLFSYISSIKYDPMYIVPFIIQDYPFNRMKLGQMWDYLVDCGMPIPKKFKDQNHSADSDIIKTYWIWKKICVPSREAFLN